MPFPFLLQSLVFVIPRAGREAELGPYAEMQCISERKLMSLESMIGFTFQVGTLFNPFLKAN